MQPIKDGNHLGGYNTSAYPMRGPSDMERAFMDLHEELVSPVNPRDNPHEGHPTGSVYSAEDFELNPFMSPTMRNFTYSPNKGSGLSFYDIFSRRFQNKKRGPGEESFRQLKMEMKPFSRIDSEVSSHSPDANVEKMASTSIFNYLNSSANSLKDIVNEKLSAFNENNSPLRLEIWRVESNADPNSNRKQSADEKSLCIEPLKINDPSERADQELSRLRNLYRVLQSVFIQGCVKTEEFYSLGEFDEELLNALLLRKFTKKLKSRELEMARDQKLELINEIVSTKSHKRPEECYKFVLTRVIKYLKKALRDSNEIIKDVEDHFYEYYFSETSKQLNLPITDFHYPLTGQKGKFKLNSLYFDKIFKSDKFLERVNFYINNILESEYKREIGKKLESLLLRWDQQLQDEGSNTEEVERTIKEYLLKNKRCKLPWTINEVEESIERFKNLIANYRTK